MNIGLIFAGGSGTRMKNKGMPKQFLEVGGKPIIIYTLEHFENHPMIDAVAVVCILEYLDYMKMLLEKFHMQKVKWLLPGGKNPLDSQHIGLKAIERDLSKGEKHIVLIHDGVRPLINADTITQCIGCVKENGSAITMTPAIETIITVDDEDRVSETIPRSRCRLGRAPQCFYLDDIVAVHEKALAEGVRDIPGKFIDSATMLQYYGRKIHVVEGPVENIKITTATDFYICRALLDAKENSQIWGL